MLQKIPELPDCYSQIWIFKCLCTKLFTKLCLHRAFDCCRKICTKADLTILRKGIGAGLENNSKKFKNSNRMNIRFLNLELTIRTDIRYTGESGSLGGFVFTSIGNEKDP
jgi:hypothetical protein